jgi:hypothetical protein
MLVNLAESINLDLLPKKKFDSSTGGRDFARKQRESGAQRRESGQSTLPPASDSVWLKQSSHH